MHASSSIAVRATLPGQILNTCSSPVAALQSCPICNPLAQLANIFAETRVPGIFGVPLRQSITYANVAISLIDENGKSYIYGYVPIVVAKCGVFLKEKGASFPCFACPCIGT